MRFLFIYKGDHHRSTNFLYRRNQRRRSYRHDDRRHLARVCFGRYRFFGYAFSREPDHAGHELVRKMVEASGRYRRNDHDLCYVRVLQRHGSGRLGRGCDPLAFLRG